jgi:plastocyanin
MATIEYWIQIENRPWDVSRHNKDRMTGQTLKAREGIDPVHVTISSPQTGHTRNTTMFKPLSDSDGKVIDALILRRYTANWAAPDDRKVNPWDLNEPNPTDQGTMGTIPGPVIECNVGDKVKVHFRSWDFRIELRPVVVAPGQPPAQIPFPLPVQMRTHSLHPHGFVFAATSDGAYPLSPEDKSQPVGLEQAQWHLLKDVKDFKKGDRVPPEGSFTYTWIAGAPDEKDPEPDPEKKKIEPWPTTAGVWLYHDHSICDMENVSLGAIGIIVIHNPDDTNQEVDIRKSDNPNELDPEFLPGGSATGPVTFRLNPQLALLEFFPPPSKALYLQLFHTLTGLGDMGGMLINGRQYLGNTPTLIAGPESLLRFGVVGMGNDFHTFHIHGHRWIVPGPNGTAVPQDDPDSFQLSPQIRAVSQFEDTRIFGPANSFVFTIREGEFFGARDDDPTGEYHMHCHVLGHMDMGMMGSLLILRENGGLFPIIGLPEGEPCPSSEMQASIIHVTNIPAVDSPNGSFNPDHISVPSGTEVTFDFQASGHSVQFDSFTNAVSIPNITGDGNPQHVHTAVSSNTKKKVTVQTQQAGGGQITYHCGLHGPAMKGTINIT